VRVARAAPTSCSDTFAAAATGATLKIDSLSSPNVSLPALTVWKSESLIASASDALRPNALMTVVRPPTAVSRSVTPAIDALLATRRNSNAFSFGTPAPRASYSPSPIADCAIPTSRLRSSTCRWNTENVRSACVPTCPSRPTDSRRFFCRAPAAPT
jgi:hypothetical protein